MGVPYADNFKYVNRFWLKKKWVGTQSVRRDFYLPHGPQSTVHPPLHHRPHANHIPLKVEGLRGYTCLEFIFQEQSYWTVQLGQSLALDYSRQTEAVFIWLSTVWPRSFLLSAEINKCDVTAAITQSPANGSNLVHC